MDFAQHTVDNARANVAAGGRPFATVFVKAVTEGWPGRPSAEAGPVKHSPAGRADPSRRNVDTATTVDVNQGVDALAGLTAESTAPEATALVVPRGL